MRVGNILRKRLLKESIAWREAWIALLLAVNFLFLIPNTRLAWRILKFTYPLTTDERRRLIMPAAWRSFHEVELKVPARATLWFVSPLEPKDWIYFLYPRLIGKGSPRAQDLMKIRQAHPNDWTIANHSADPAQDFLDLWPPLDIQR